MNKINRLMASMLLVLAMCALAAAQDAAPKPKAPAPPSFCKPCLWYSGDFDTNASNANAWANEKDLVISQSAVYVPFRVPTGKIWKITGVFGVVLSEVTIIDPPQADWSISKGVSAGHAGKVIASGTSPATLPYLGCQGGLAINCEGVLVKGIHVTLKAGKYWLMVVPYCTNSNDSSCQNGARYFLANEEDDPHPLNHVGPKNILHQSFWNSTYFHANFELLTPAVCDGCDMFSAGLVGTSKTEDAEFGGQ
jgi:hypothetical protein